MRSIGKEQYVIAAHNKANNSIDIFSYQHNQLQLLSSQIEKSAALEGLCLYQDGAKVYAYVLKSDQNVEQRLVFDSLANQAKQHTIRQLPLSHNVTACSVNDQSNQLFIAEETIGVWQFDARAEATVTRHGVAMVKPFGQLKSEIKALKVLTDGTLLISQAQEQKIAIYQPEQANLQWVNVTGDEVEIFDARWLSDKQLQIHYFDEETLWQQLRLDLSAKPVSTEAFIAELAADGETAPVARMGDAADDPAIWLNPTHSENSLILATDKKSGLAVYDLAGQQTQFIPSGRINNVDLRYGFDLNGQQVSLAAASNRDHNSISFYQITDNGVVTELNQTATSLDEVYGLCMHHDASSDQYYVFINDKDGRYEGYQVTAQNSQIKTSLTHEFRLIDQPEGCVVNDKTGDIFLGIEDHGIWHMNVSVPQQPTKIAGLSTKVTDDIEGIAIYHGESINDSYLVVSSQGNNSYALYHAYPPFDYIDSFRISANFDLGIDGASETDGLAVHSSYFSKDYPNGLLVVQDGRNLMPHQAQNFKLLSFEKVLNHFNLK
nr:phytase [Marinifaba aquimaris]